LKLLEISYDAVHEIEITYLKLLTWN